MDITQHFPPEIASALMQVKKAAAQVLRCPACQSSQIYTTLNVAFFFDHTTREASLGSIRNLAEHGWHGCRSCHHKWVSNIMLKTALPAGESPATHDNVIELADHKKSTS